jgi:hypothetical protein
MTLPVRVLVCSFRSASGAPLDSIEKGSKGGMLCMTPSCCDAVDSSVAASLGLASPKGGVEKVETTTSVMIRREER